MISEEHVLALPDFDKEFVVECDSSNFGVGGVISQKSGRHYQPIAYFSKHLSKTERNYSTSEREMLAIILSVEHFKEYIYGRQFRIVTDHEPLKFTATCDTLSIRLARLQKRLNIYNAVIEYRAGKNHGNCDALSRMVDEGTYDNDDTEDDEIMINTINFKPTEIENKQEQDEYLKWIIEFISKHKTRSHIQEFENIECKSLYK